MFKYKLYFKLIEYKIKEYNINKKGFFIKVLLK